MSHLYHSSQEFLLPGKCSLVTILGAISVHSQGVLERHGLHYALAAVSSIFGGGAPMTLALL